MKLRFFGPALAIVMILSSATACRAQGVAKELTEDERHRLFQAAIVTNDGGLRTKALAALKLETPTAVTAFQHKHVIWGLRHEAAADASGPAGAEKVMRELLGEEVVGPAMTEDQRHELYMVIGAIADEATVHRAMKRLNLTYADGMPTKEMDGFLKAHDDWSDKNRKFIRDHLNPETAKAWLDKSGLLKAAEIKLVWPEDQHRMFEAAVVTGDDALLKEVLDKIGIREGETFPGVAMFGSEHLAWTQSSGDWIKAKAGDPDAAREWLKKSAGIPAK